MVVERSRACARTPFHSDRGAVECIFEFQVPSSNQDQNGSRRDSRFERRTRRRRHSSTRSAIGIRHYSSQLVRISIRYFSFHFSFSIRVRLGVRRGCLPVSSVSQSVKSVSVTCFIFVRVTLTKRRTFYVIVRRSFRHSTRIEYRSVDRRRRHRQLAAVAYDNSK